MAKPSDRAIAMAAEKMYRLADVIRKHGFCPPLALDAVADEFKAALAATPEGAQAVAVETIRDHIAETMHGWSKSYRTDQFREDLRMAIGCMKPLYTAPPAASEDAADAARWRWVFERAWFVDAAAHVFDLRFGPGDFSTEPHNADPDDARDAIDSAMAIDAARDEEKG